MSVFLETNHLFLRNPHGGVEDVAAMKAAGFGAIFCNIGDYPPSEWELIRDRARQAKVVCGPWLRTADSAGNFSAEKFRFLVETADRWETPLIVNSESELRGSGKELTVQMAVALGDRDAALSMEPWPFANVEWWPMAAYPVLPQIFPQDADAATRPDDCKYQWQKLGIKCVVFTFGSYGTQKPSDYKRLAPYGVYTADDCGINYNPWSPTGVTVPCKDDGDDGDFEEEEFMALIGNQHGITAFIEWLKKQPGVPTAHKPNYDANNPATWPWPERLQRTLNMLREDHDKDEIH